MPFILSRETRKCIFHSWRNLNFLFILYNLKRNRFFTVNDVIHVRTLRHINDDVA